MGILGQGKSLDEQRTEMVDRQLIARGISDPDVLKAMRGVPRDRFVPTKFLSDAYKDGPLPIGGGQTISQPYMVAVMTENLEIEPDNKILEIGTGSGYQTAVLLALTDNVYSIERITDIAEHARAVLRDLGYSDPNIKIGDGTLGWPEEGPFDGIIITSGAPSVPEPLKEQLADGGRMVIPVGPRHTQTLLKITRQGNRYTEKEITACVFVPLIGKHGWQQDTSL